MRSLAFAMALTVLVGEPTPVELVALLNSADRIEREEAARTLEELLSQLFAGNHAALGGSFLSSDATALAQLVTFLLSIDENAGMAMAIPQQMLGFNPVLCPMMLTGM